MPIKTANPPKNRFEKYNIKAVGVGDVQSIHLGIGNPLGNPVRDMFATCSLGWLGCICADHLRALKSQGQ